MWLHCAKLAECIEILVGVETLVWEKLGYFGLLCVALKWLQLYTFIVVGMDEVLPNRKPYIPQTGKVEYSFLLYGLYKATLCLYVCLSFVTGCSIFLAKHNLA